MSDNLAESKSNDIEQPGNDELENKQAPPQEDSFFDKLGDIIMSIIKFIYKQDRFYLQNNKQKVFKFLKSENYQLIRF